MSSGGVRRSLRWLGRLRKDGWPMCETGCECEWKQRGDAMDEVDRVLHGLCQPLTTLRCRLELAGLIGTLEAYQEAVNLGLVECVRMVEGVESLREIVHVTKGE